ncbi:hypothetical protein, partial [Bradyrhizobium liaoningense]|uniref:hypothetical protein n=1 Tax=Bradyrhizobium liaoningense TaxID=43992 RepID=UPI0024E126B7
RSTGLLTFPALDDIMKLTHANDATGGRLQIGIPGRLRWNPHAEWRAVNFSHNNTDFNARESRHGAAYNAAIAAASKTGGRASRISFDPDGG